MSRTKKTDATKKYSLQEEFKPRTKNQSEYVRTMIENDITFVTGAAGSGKSFLAIGLACQYLLDGRCKKIVIARPAIEASPKGLGYLKGSLSEKLEPYVSPAIDHLKRFLGRDTYYNAIRDEKIEFAAIEYLRGATFLDTFLVTEESQNLNKAQCLMLLTRIGEGSKFVLNGDTDQTDLRKENAEFSTDFAYVIDKLYKANIKGIGFAEMDHNDIQRHGLIGPILEAFRL